MKQNPLNNAVKLQLPDSLGLHLIFSNHFDKKKKPESPKKKWTKITVLFQCPQNFKWLQCNYSLDLQKIFLGPWPRKELYSLSFAVSFYFSIHFSSPQWEAMLLWGLKNSWRFKFILKNYYNAMRLIIIINVFGM